MSKRSEEDCYEELNTGLHALVGYGDDDIAAASRTDIQKALALVDAHLQTFGGGFLATRWRDKLTAAVVPSGDTTRAKNNSSTSSAATSSISTDDKLTAAVVPGGDTTRAKNNSSTSPAATIISSISTDTTVTSTLSNLQPVVVQRRSGGVGGSQQTVIQRVRRQQGEPKSRKESALQRVISKLGEARVEKIRTDWGAMESGVGGSEWMQSEGIIISLLQCGLSEIEIRAVIPVGGSKIDRLRKMLHNGIETLHTRRPPRVPAHAVSDECMDRIKSDAMTWEVEDGFSCAHRRPKQYLLDPLLTFTKLYAL